MLLGSLEPLVWPICRTLLAFSRTRARAKHIALTNVVIWLWLCSAGLFQFAQSLLQQRVFSADTVILMDLKSSSRDYVFLFYIYIMKEGCLGLSEQYKLS